MNKVFVYGTLKSNCGSHWILGDSKFLGTYRIEGYVMYALDAFPVALEGSSEDGFVGELYEVSDSVLRELDKYEGYHENYEETSLYIRDKVDIVGYPESVFMYVFKNGIGISETHKPCYNYGRDIIFYEDDFMYELENGDPVAVYRREDGVVSELTFCFDTMSIIDLNMTIEHQLEGKKNETSSKRKN